MYEYAFLNSNPDQNLFYNLCKGSKHTYGAAGHYVSYLYCRSLSHVEITLMNAYIKGAISKQILRYLATFKREREMLNLWLPSLQALTALHLLNMLAKMIIWHSLYSSKHSVNYSGISFFKKPRFRNIQICKVEKILKGSLDSIPSPSPSVKIQIMGGKVCFRCEGKTLLGIVYKLLKTKKC